MYIKLVRGKKLHGPGDRSYPNSSTEYIKVDTQFPGCKKEIVGCGEVKTSCTRYKLPIATISTKRTIYCEDPCDPNAEVVPRERFKLDPYSGCKKC